MPYREGNVTYAGVFNCIAPLVHTGARSLEHTTIESLLRNQLYTPHRRI